MFPRGARVLVAVSGGADSVALLHILRALEARGELSVAGVGHFNHGLRGADADADERFCAELAASLGIPFESGRGDVAAAARTRGRSIEDAARTLRYAFLREAADRRQAEVIAVGHTLDDQAETFLLRLMRGAGPGGLAGIRPRSERVVRPLLDVSRNDLRAYVTENALPFREDATNADVRIPRNQIRHEVIPFLQRSTSSLVPTLARAATVARQDAEYLDRVAIDFARSIVLRTDQSEEPEVSIECKPLLDLPPALASRVAREALAIAAPHKFIGFQHIERLLELATGAEGAAVALPGLTAVRRGGRIVLGQPPPAPFSNSFRFPLSIPGEVALVGWAVSAERIDQPIGIGHPPARGGTVVVAAGPLQGPLAVRTRRPGDRFRPLGMGGRGRKLQDFLVDRKVSRIDRDRLPLVVDRDDRIVWVVGESVAEDFRITAPEQGVILLKARRLGGVG